MIFMKRWQSRLIIGLVVALVMLGASPALAEKGSGKKGKTGDITAEHAKDILISEFSSELAGLPRNASPEPEGSALVVRDDTGTASLTVPGEAAGKVKLRDAGVGIAIATGDTSDTASTEIPGGRLFANTDVSTDTVVVPLSEDAVEILTVLRGPDAPQQLITALSLAPGQRLVAGPENTAAIVDPLDHPVVIIYAPWAVDADGQPVALFLTTSDNSLTLSVEHSDNTVSYPVLVDPFYYLDAYANDAEQAWCWPFSRWAICARAHGHADSAESQALAYYPANTMHNGVGDAFRHCYWSARMTINDGATHAKGFGDRHEDYPGNPPLEKEMDLANNSTGRSIAGGKDWTTFTYVRDKCKYRADGHWLVQLF